MDAMVGRGRNLLGLAVIGLLCCTAPAAAAGGLKDGHVAIGMDCGSSGSRICVYTYDKDPMDLVPVGTDCLNIHPGLSSYADTPRKAGESMKALFDHAISLGVPTGTKVFLAATAGLRALPDARAVDLIMDSVRDYLNNNYSPQLVWADTYPRVLSGNEEGVFGWAAVNHMMGRLGENIQKTVGTLDMGGSSTQITFVPKDPVDVPQGYQFSFPWGDKVYNLYTHSFAGYGYNDARAAMLSEASTESDGWSEPMILIDPCALSGYRGEQEVGDQNVTVAGTGSWGDCTDRCKLLLAKHWPCVSVDGGTGVVTSGGYRRGGHMKDQTERSGFVAPCSTNQDGANRVLFTDPVSTEFLALSNFADIEKALGLPVEADVGEILQKGRELCSTRWSELKKTHKDLDQQTLSTYCFGASYIYEVLHEGYHFPPSMKLHFAKRLSSDGMKHVKISWTRGMILYELTKGGSAAEHKLSGFHNTVAAGDGGADFTGGFLLLGMLGAGIVMAAGFALVRSSAELREVVSTGVHSGMGKLSEGRKMASSAASKGKKIVVSSLPEQMPFEVPRMFSKGVAAYDGYEDVEGDGSASAAKQPLSASARQGVRGGAGYGSISTNAEAAHANKENVAQADAPKAGGMFAFGKIFPQIQEAGRSLMRRSNNPDTAMSQLIPATTAGTGKGEEAGDEEGGCMVCEGRRKMGVEGLCGMCKTRDVDDSDKC
mmetsp:Transcript_43212/g.105756  ORF Transcript_43212/g.105756 Transcript_43212/m.105756 type:complete len:713 (-) Transcript_43212:160-2298(-)